MNTREDQIEQARRLIATGISEDLKAVLYQQYPELKESDDERIRKWLIEEIKATHDYDSPTSKKCVDDALAYLEKQKEQKHPLNFDAISSWLRDHASNYVNGEFNEFHHCVEYDGTFNVEKLIVDLKVAVDGGAFDVLDNEQKEQKPADWSEEDERMLKAIIGGLGCIQKAGCERFGGEEMSDVILWIKNRFKSLRPWPHWKPSEEQVSALNYFIKLWGNSDDQLEYTKIFNTVKSLRDDLEKLM